VIDSALMTGTDEGLRVAQIRFHRAIHGEAFRSGLDHLSRASQEAEKQGEKLAEILIAQPYDSTWVVAAHRKIGRETIDQMAGAAFVLAQKHIETIAGAVVDIGKACDKGGYGPLKLAAFSKLKLRNLKPEIDHIFGVANFWKHGHEEKLRALTLAMLNALGVNYQDADAFPTLISKFDLGAPLYGFLTLWSKVKGWGESLLPEVLAELEPKGVLMLESYSETGGKIWVWKKNGRKIPMHEYADLFRWD
jgi:hypothetical protein